MNRFSPWKSRSIALAIGFSTLSFSASSLLSQETWTNVTGDKSFTAEFVKLEGVQLTLKKSDGKEVVFPLSKLDDKSRLRARAIARNGGVSDSPSPDGGTAPTTNLAPVAFPSSSTAQEFMDIVVRELQKENPMVLWDALPASKQNQVQEIVQLASTKVEQKTLNLIKKFRGDLLAALRSKKQFVLNSRVIAMLPDQKTNLTSSYDSIVELIEASLPVEWMDSTYLQKTPIRDVLASYLGRLNQLQKKLKAAASLASITANAQTISPTEADVTFAGPGVPRTPNKFLLSEGRWLPQDLLDNWDQAMGQATSVLEAVSSKEIHMGVGQGMLFLNGLLGAISSAETQEDFDEQIGQLMAMAQGMGGMGGPGLGGPGR